MSPSPLRARPVSVVALLLACLVALGAPAAQTVGVVSPDPDVLVDPVARALDGAGNLYVASFTSDNLLRIAPDGAATVLASGDVALPAPFLDPRAIAVDESDNVYVACAGSDNVFRFEPGGAVSIVLDASGDGLGAVLDQPTSVVALGNDVWVGGFGSDNVFHVSGAGVVSLVLDAAGVGGTALDQADVRTDAGRVFVLGQSALFEVGPGSVVTALVDATGDGTINFGIPTDVCVDTAGNAFVVDSSTVFSVSPGGTVTAAFSLFFSIGGAEITSDSLGSTWVAHSLFGSELHLTELPPGGRPVTVLNNGFDYEGLTADDAGNLYWVRPQSVGSDWLLRRASDGTLTVMIGQLGAGNGAFLDGGVAPLVAPDGSVYVLGRQSDNVMHAGAGFVDLLVAPPEVLVDVPLAVDVGRDGRVIIGGFSEVAAFDLEQDAQELLADSDGDGLGNPLFNVVAVEEDHAGNVWVAARNTNSVFRISPSGAVDLVLDQTGAGGQSFFQPYDLAVDAQDNVFVSGQGSHNVFRIAPDGTATAVITSAGDGTIALTSPQGVAVDGAGNLYVASLGTDSVFEVQPGGTITRIVTPTGAGTPAGLDNPTGVAATWQGDVFITGDFSHNVLHVDPSGVVTEVLDADGDGLGSTLQRPVQVEVDGFGAAYVVGRDSDNVFRVHPDGTVTVLLDAAGAGPHAPLDQPLKLAVDLSGNVFAVGGTSANVLSVTQDDWFTDLGGSSLGSNGRPTMWTKGDLTPGSTQDRVLTNVPPNALMLVWIAFTSTPFDAIGGTVHAFPFSRQVLFVADPTGYSELFLPWPAGITPGIDIYLQFVVQDLSVPDGLTLSNATVQTTP